jgi:hypothetical protein
VATEEINVPITTTYDDKGAKEALKDVEKLDKAHPTPDFSAAEKSTGGFKDKLSGLNDSLGGLGASLAPAAAGAAIGKFVGDSMAKFGELGEAVEKFSTVSGTGAEDASRWVAVADDYGVSAETISGAVGKIGKTLGGNADALKDYGVQVAYASDGTVDLTQTTLNAVDAYNATTDPAKKAALGTAAFGKSYQELIPLIDEGSKSIKSSFDDVSKAQLFDDAKVREAKNYRLAMDDLHDSLGDFELEVGRVAIPVLVDFVDQLTSVAGAFTAVADALPTGTIPFLEHFGHLLDPINAALELWPPNMKKMLDSHDPKPIEVMATSLEHAGDAAGQWAKDFDFAGAAVEADAASAERKHKELADAVDADVAAMKRSWSDLRGGLTLDDAVLSLEDSFAKVKTAGVDAMKATADGAADADQKQRDYQHTINDSKQKVIDLGEQLGLSLNQTTTLVAKVDKGELDAVEDQIEVLRRNNKINLEIVAKGGAGYGAITGPGAGPRMAPAAASSSSTVVNVNMPRGSNGVDVVRQIAGQTRRNGRRYGSPVVHFARR